MTDALLNDFATRSFRDTADHDYISARLCYRHGLVEQFHWQSLQALEKYLKAILLYNRVVADKVGHDLSKAMEKAKECPFKFDFSESTYKFIRHIDTFGRFRYLESFYFIHGAKLFELDRAVWEIRRFCRVLNHEKSRPGGETTSMLEFELLRIKQSREKSPQAFSIPGGELEKILSKKNHLARSALIWQNLYFGTGRRKKARQPTHSQSKNAPLTLHPEILDEVRRYVFLPKEVIEAYRSRS